MYYNLYTIYDRIAEECCAPIMLKTDGAAMRFFIQQFRQNNSPGVDINEHILFRVGSFDNEKMKLKTLDEPIALHLEDINKMESENNETI